MFKHTVTMDRDTYGGERIKCNPSSATMVERRITADQILHLCKLLAEQSKAKSFDRRKKISEDDCGSSRMEIQSEDITSSRSSEQEFCDRVNNNAEGHQQEIVLADSNIVAATTTTTTMTVSTTSTVTTTTKQVKKDILNKIRNQIFERKRQKLAIGQKRNASVVWRPW
ncbi:uncharacterized protein LOC129946513 [Eupeodes corollae]|uniref:uncharacterized protein LOC129946513 n=1 Tax=Eupeodes corollae TaxID=290404 RepID=UPI002490EB86|nr:uncharacterized protein LOC129946513 [Eupeodes corollae]XP_055912702.1 uncharacterized protein LOC129946513 [Eupeodes corollae]